MLFFRSLSISKLFKEHTVITVASGEGPTPAAHYGVLADPDGFDHLIEGQLRERLAHLEKGHRCLYRFYFIAETP